MFTTQTILFSPVIDTFLDVIFNILWVVFAFLAYFAYSVNRIKSSYNKLLKTEEYLEIALNAYIELCNLTMKKFKEGDLYDKILQIKLYAGETVKKEKLKAYYAAKGIVGELALSDDIAARDFIANTDNIAELIDSYNTCAKSVNKSFGNPMSRRVAQNASIIKIADIDK